MGYAYGIRRQWRLHRHLERRSVDFKPTCPPGQDGSGCFCLSCGDTDMLQTLSLDWIGTAMKAAFFMQHGGPEVLQYGDVPDPVAGTGDVLVNIHAASVNAADWQMRAGRYAPVARFPYVPGRDFSGV